MSHARLSIGVLMLSATCARAITACPRQSYDSDLPDGISALRIGALLTLGVVVLYALYAAHIRRVRAAQGAVAEPISLLIVELLARKVQRRNGVVAAAGLVGVPAMVVMNSGGVAILSTIVACVGLRGYFLARAALQLIEASAADVRAELLGFTVVVRSGYREAQLEISPRALAAASRNAVPTSIAKWS